jgi:hypothetical protein
MTLTKETIQIRCTDCEECDTRWSWAATLQNNVTPIMKHKLKTVAPRRVLWEQHNCKPVPDGMCVVTTCQNPLCCNPELLKAVSKGSIIKRTAKTGAFSTPVFRAKVAAGKRRTSKLSDQDVHEIIASDEETKTIAARKNITSAYVNMIRAGRFRRDYNNPLQGLMR